MMKKYFAGLSLFLLFFIALSARTAHADTCSFTRDLTLGSVGSDVKCLQQFLNANGYTIAVSGTGSSGNESTYFGSLTKTAIAKWQATNGITLATGYFGSISRAKYSLLSGTTAVTPTTSSSVPICIIASILARGSQGDEVLCLQRLLIAQNLLPANLATGFFGAITQAAVSAFQRAHNLEPVGQVGRLTRGMLNAINTNEGSGKNTGSGGAVGGKGDNAGNVGNGGSVGGGGSGSGGSGGSGGGGASCVLDGTTIADGASQIFYSASTAAYPMTCASISLSRTCTNGNFAGSSVYNKAGCSVTGSDDYDIILVAGQSNTISGLGTFFDDHSLDNKIFQLDRSADPAKDKQIILSTDVLKAWHATSSIGFAMSFAREYAKTMPASRKVLIVAASHGATSIAEWMPGSHAALLGHTSEELYADMRARLNFALTQSSSNKLVAVLWHQGESDTAADRAPLYESRLRSLFLQLRSDFSSQGNFPIIMGKLVPSWNSASSLKAQVETAMATVANDPTTYSAVVSSDGLKSNYEDGVSTNVAEKIHFSASSQIEFGKRYYAKFRGLTSPTAPTAILSASPASIVSGTGASSILTAVTTNVASCESGWTLKSGTTDTYTRSVSPTATTAYSVTCQNSAGASVTSNSVTVSVTTPLVSACTTLTPFNGSSNDASIALQKCIDDISDGGTVELPLGKYTIANEIVLKNKKSITLRTQGKDLNSPYCTINDPTCVEIIASRDLKHVGGAGGVMAQIFGTNVTINNIIWNGNRQNRLDTLAATDWCGTPNGKDYIIQSRCFGSCIYQGNVVKNALCGTGWAGDGAPTAHVSMTGNTSAYNGDHSRKNMWADGFTLVSFSNLTFQRNTVINGTDVDIILGGCTHCVVFDNTITHESGYANSSFVGMAIHSWPDLTNVRPLSGDYTDTVFTQNTINCGPTFGCGFGLTVGAHAWYVTKTFGAKIFGNTILNAQQGVNVDGDPVRDITIYNNTVSNILGYTNTNCGVRVASKYNLASSSAQSTIDRSQDTSGAMYTNFTWTGCIPNNGNPAPPGEIELFVVRLYEYALGRHPEAAGKMAQVGLLTNTPTIIECKLIMRNFYNSAEFQARTLTNQQFVESLYRAVFGREPGSGGLRAWTNVLDAGTQTRAQLVDAFVNHAEATSYCAGILGVATPSAPTVSLSATPASIVSGTGASSILTAVTTNVASCESGWTLKSGTTDTYTRSVSPTATTAYSVTCQNSAGASVTPNSVTVSVNPFKMISGASPLQVPSGTIAFQTDGKLVLLDPSGIILWTTTGSPQSCSPGNCLAQFQADGNLVLYYRASATAPWAWYWASKTGGNSGAQLIFSAQAPYLKILKSDGTQLWQSSATSANFLERVANTAAAVWSLIW